MIMTYRTVSFLLSVDYSSEMTIGAARASTSPG